MFITNRNNLYRDIFDSEYVLFSQAEMAIYEPWFMCEVPEFDADEEVLCTTTHLLADINKLTEFASNNKTAKAYVISPGYLNKSKSWKLQILKSVLQAKYKVDDESGCIYRFEVENGSGFDHDLQGKREFSEDLNFKTILKFD